MIDTIQDMERSLRLPSLLLFVSIMSCADTRPKPASSAPACRAVIGDVPYVAGEFSRVFAPRGTRYLNDHTLVRGSDGKWHVYGITNEIFTSSLDERRLLHATAPSLAGPWNDEPDILEATAPETVLWAPYAFQTAPGAWTLYVWTGGAGIRRADSVDLFRWTRIEGDRPPGGRDPFVLRDGDRWLLYSVGVDSASRGQILVTETTRIDERTSWAPAIPVITSPVPDPALPDGNLESPTVVPYHGQYYLFLTNVALTHVDYNRTYVFRSSDPKKFEWAPITTLRAHAPEIVREDGRWYITSCGWTTEIGERARGLSVAPLGWAAQ